MAFYNDRALVILQVLQSCMDRMVLVTSVATYLGITDVDGVDWGK